MSIVLEAVRTPLGCPCALRQCSGESEATGWLAGTVHYLCVCVCQSVDFYLFLCVYVYVCVYLCVNVSLC